MLLSITPGTGFLLVMLAAVALVFPVMNIIFGKSDGSQEGAKETVTLPKKPNSKYE